MSLFNWPTLAVGLSVWQALPIYMAAGLYQAVFCRMDSRIISAIAGASLCYGIFYAMTISAYAFDNFPERLA